MDGMEQAMQDRPGGLSYPDLWLSHCSPCAEAPGQFGSFSGAEGERSVVCLPIDRPVPGSR